MPDGWNLEAHPRNDRDPATRVESVGGDEELFHFDAAVHPLGDLRERFPRTHDMRKRARITGHAKERRRDRGGGK
jgi:hypothetical protein